MGRVRRHVVVGASAAGMAAALSMRSHGFDGEIVVVDASRHEPYERPPLSKELMTGESMALRPIAPPSLLDEQRIVLRLGAGVASLDPQGKRVVLDDGTAVSGDHVVLATGARARRLGVPGSDLPGVMVLRDADDAMAINARLAHGGPLVVVGGGFVGLELAALARTHGIEADVVETEPLPLARALGPQLAQTMLEMHVERGVRFHLGTSVERLEGTSEVEEVVLAGGTRLRAHTVVVGIGVLPNDDLARAAGVAVADGIVVDAYGATSNPWLLAAGDVAARPNPWLPAPARVEHWNSAQSHGTAVGATCAGVPTRDDAVPYFWSDQYETTLQSFGRGQPGDQIVVRAGAEPAQSIAFWLREGRRVIAVAGLDMPREVRAGRTLIESGVDVDADRLSDPDSDLRRLAKQARVRS